MSEQNLVVEYDQQYGQTRDCVRIEGLLLHQVGCVAEWCKDQSKTFPTFGQQLHQQTVEQTPEVPRDFNKELLQGHTKWLTVHGEWLKNHSELIRELRSDVDKIVNKTVDKNSPIGEADDSSERIMEEWLLSVGFAVWKWQYHSHFSLNRCHIMHTPGGGFTSSTLHDSYPIITRRDVRILCELLRVELKEKK